MQNQLTLSHHESEKSNPARLVTFTPTKGGSTYKLKVVTHDTDWLVRLIEGVTARGPGTTIFDLSPAEHSSAHRQIVEFEEWHPGEVAEVTFTIYEVGMETPIVERTIKLKA